MATGILILTKITPHGHTVKTKEVGREQDHQASKVGTRN